MKLGNCLKSAAKLSTTYYVLVVLLFSPPAYCENQGEVSPKLNQIIRKNIQRNINALPKMEQKIKNDIAPWVSTQGEKEGIDGIPGPEVNPLDKLQGHLDEGKSWNEYATDSKIILNDETFPQCLEPRLVAEYEGGHKYVDPLNILTGLACEFNCHDHGFLGLIDPVYQFQKWKAISYYWPEHQISINKSGAQMIDPDIVRENRGSQELYRQPTADREDSDPIRGEDTQLDMLDRMGFPRNQYKDPDYHKPGKDYHLQQDGEVRYGSSMRTNLDAQAAHKRPPFIQGWETSEACLFNALNVKTDKKKVIHNRFDQGIYAITARYPETKKKLDPKRYRYTSPQAIQLSQYKQNTPNQFRESLCASWRMASNPEVYGDLEKVGFKGVNDPAYKTYCLPNGEALSGSMTFLENTPRLQADAVRAVMTAVYFGSDKLNFNGKNLNKEPLRPNWYTLYEKRENSSVPRYVGSGYKSVEFNPGENKSNVIFVDKIQRIYPTQPRGSGNVDGVGGESSEGMRQGIAQRGSHCFRPEDIPNWSSEGRTNVSEWPLGLVQDVRKHYGETRWAVWNRRVLCSCEIKSLPWGVGCLSLNSGDKEEAGFIGTVPLAGDMPPPFKKAIPGLRKLADERTPASGGGPDFKGLDIPIIDIGALGAGPSAPQMPGGQQPPPELEGPPADFNLIPICLPINNQNQGNNGNNQSPCPGGVCPANGGGSGNNFGSGNIFGGDIFTPQGCENGQCGIRLSGIDEGKNSIPPTKLLKRNDDDSILISSNSLYQVCKKTTEENGKSFYSCEQSNEKSIKGATPGSIPPIELFPIGPSVGSGTTTPGGNTSNNVCTGPNCGNPNNVCTGPNCGNAAQGSCANGNCQNSFVQQGSNGQQFICFFGQPPSGQCQGGTCTAPGGGCSGGTCTAPGGGCSGGTCTSGAGGGCGAGGCGGGGGGGSGGGGFGGGGFGGIIPGLSGAFPGLGLPGLNGLGNLPIQGNLPNLGSIGSGGLGNLPSGLNGLPSGLSNIPNGLNSSVPGLNGIQNIPNLPTSLPNLGNNSNPKPSPSIKASEPKPSPSPSANSVNNETIEQF